MVVGQTAKRMDGRTDERIHLTLIGFDLLSMLKMVPCRKEKRKQNVVVVVVRRTKKKNTRKENGSGNEWSVKWVNEWVSKGVPTVIWLGAKIIFVALFLLYFFSV